MLNIQDLTKPGQTYGAYKNAIAKLHKARKAALFEHNELTGRRSRAFGRGRDEIDRAMAACLADAARFLEAIADLEALAAKAPN